MIDPSKYSVHALASWVRWIQFFHPISDHQLRALDGFERQARIANVMDELTILEDLEPCKVSQMLIDERRARLKTLLKWP